MSSSILVERCIALVTKLGLLNKEDIIDVTPLTGGVASDIAVIRTADKKLCAKFALEKLKVEEDWCAPVHRNLSEYRWLRCAADIAPKNAPKLLGASSELGGFVMEFIEGDSVYLWKNSLLAGFDPKDEAAKVGALLGTIHAVSSDSKFNSSQFQNQDDFHSIRIEPYLIFTGEQHPELVQEYSHLVSSVASNEFALIHGDVSPKNIFFRDSEPIILDAECATMGDPAFDIAFCLNHLFLKAIHLPAQRETLLEEVLSFWDAYAPHVNWESAGTLQQRVTSQLPALMLARVDGKSPVEYLTDSQRAEVRSLAIPLIKVPTVTLQDFVYTVHSFYRKAHQ